MRVTLVNPGLNTEFATSEPLNLESIATYLKSKGIGVKIIDELAGQNVKHEILKYRPDLVGLTAVTPLAPDAYRIADFCRAIGIRVVMGGVHATVMTEEALKHVDIVVKGEGENAILNIIHQNIKTGIVNGIPLTSLDEIPLLDKSDIDMDFYLRLPETYLVGIKPGTRVGTLITSRGCNHHCAFCHNFWHDIQYRCNSAERVIAEVERLIKVYKVKAVYFLDDNFFLNKPRTRKICQMLIDSKMNISWVANSRVDTIDSETLRLAKLSGCKCVQFGFESGSQRILDLLNKKTTVGQNAQAIKLCHEAGLMAQGTFMIGIPTDTVEDIRLTQKFIKENPVDGAAICITTPFPGTQIWDWCQDHNYIPAAVDWSKFTLTRWNPSGITVCDTIPLSQLKELFVETDKLISHTKNKIPRGWFLSMVINHPVKSLTMAYRSRQYWSKYFTRIGG